MAALESRPLLRSIVVLAVNTGMRRGELLSLRWEQVDISRGVIQVVNTKSGRGRVVPINSAAGRELEALRLVTGEYVFRSPRTGGRLTSIKTAWSAACREAGLEDFRFHDLRHTAGTRLGDAGAGLKTIAEILGHSTVQMSARYTHATDEAKRRAVESIAEAGNVCLKFVTKEKRQA